MKTYSNVNPLSRPPRNSGDHSIEKVVEAAKAIVKDTLTEMATGKIGLAAGQTKINTAKKMIADYEAELKRERGGIK